MHCLLGAVFFPFLVQWSFVAATTTQETTQDPAATAFTFQGPIVLTVRSADNLGWDHSTLEAGTKATLASIAEVAIDEVTINLIQPVNLFVAFIYNIDYSVTLSVADHGDTAMQNANAARSRIRDVDETTFANTYKANLVDYAEDITGVTIDAPAVEVVTTSSAATATGAATTTDMFLEGDDALVVSNDTNDTNTTGGAAAISCWAVALLVLRL